MELYSQVLGGTSQALKANSIRFVTHRIHAHTDSQQNIVSSAYACRVHGPKHTWNPVFLGHKSLRAPSYTPHTYMPFVKPSLLHHPEGSLSATNQQQPKGCFVFLLPETLWTHRLPFSHGYLLTAAWICKSLSWLLAITEGKCFIHSLSAQGESVHR